MLGDDYGTGNSLLEQLALDTRFSGLLLLDPMFKDTNSHLPRILHVVDSPYTQNVEELTFNYPTVLNAAEDVTVLAWSTDYSYLVDGSHQLTGDSPVGPFPVMAEVTVGDGRMILISDSSLFINSMENLASNYTFIQNIAAVTTSEVLIDHSHLPLSNLRQPKNLLAAIRDPFTTPVGAVSLVILVLIITLIPIWHKKER